MPGALKLYAQHIHYIKSRHYGAANISLAISLEVYKKASMGLTMTFRRARLGCGRSGMAASLGPCAKGDSGGSGRPPTPAREPPA